MDIAAIKAEMAQVVENGATTNYLSCDFSLGNPCRYCFEWYMRKPMMFQPDVCMVCALSCENALSCGHRLCRGCFHQALVEKWIAQGHLDSPRTPWRFRFFVLEDFKCYVCRKTATPFGSHASIVQEGLLSSYLLQQNKPHNASVDVQTTHTATQTPNDQATQTEVPVKYSLVRRLLSCFY